MKSIRTKQEIADENWEILFKMAQKFYKTNHHLLIPSNYIYRGKRLGRWIETQRQNYHKRNNSFFTEERIKRLESIGMVWNVKQFFWDKMYKELLKYRDSYQNIRVPQSYITDTNRLLGSWLNLQRENYKNHKMTDYQKNQLDKLGMIWNPKKLIENNWNRNFQLLKEYKKKYNQFPKANYITDNGIKLGAWLSTQKSKYKSNKLYLERKSKLEKLGVFYNPNWDNWDKMYQQAQNFYNQNKTLVFYDFDGTYDKNLAVWLMQQRRLYLQGKLQTSQIKKLESIGMVWDVSKYYWNKMYQKAKKFYKINGHLHVSKNPNTSKDLKLGLWLDGQRRMHRMNQNYNKSHITKLESIGMEWNLYRSPEAIWQDWYLKAKSFYQKNHHLNPPPGKLKTWVLAQKAAKKKIRGRITLKQIKLLEKIGIEWDVKENNWNKMYEYARQFYEIHEMLNIPVNYTTQDGYKLGIWISRQRNVYKNKLKNIQEANQTIKKRIQLLNQIGMIWDASKLTVRTSFQEKAIFYYLSKTYKDTQKINRWELFGYELDIYIPSIKTAIEYDGIWHKNTIENDNKKNKACQENGITLIRIREPNLPKVSNCPIIIEMCDNSDTSLEDAIKQLFFLLNIKINDLSIQKDRSKILEAYKDYTSHAWDRNYEKLYYLYKTSSAIFPITKYSHIDKQLRYWINSQRNEYKNGLLTPLQIKKLYKIGFDFGPYESTWQRMYQQAKEYYHKNKNLKIPYNYKTSNGKPLGVWLSKQKKLYRENKLDTNHILLLEKLEINWNRDINKTFQNIKDITKNPYFQELKKYYEKNGNIDIPREYISENGLKLGKWLSRRRSNYKNKTLNQNMVDELNKLKIKWKVIEEKWEEMFRIAEEYYQKHGNILISANYKTEDGIHLGDWISKQRQKLNAKNGSKRLTRKQIQKLNSLEMIWNPYHVKWLEKYKLAKEFYKENGHLNIPVNYITQDGVKLGMWVATQRQANRGNPNFLMTEERKKLLNQIGMNWKLKNSRQNTKKRQESI